MSEVDELVNKIKLKESAITIKDTILNDLIMPIKKAGFDVEEIRMYVAGFLMSCECTHLIPLALLEINRAYGIKDGTTTTKPS